jgi:hypothetical protein
MGGTDVVGTNIGIYVKRQEEGFMMYGSNPRGSLSEIGESVRTFVSERVPKIDEKAAYSVFDPEIREGWYRFDVRLFVRGEYLPDDGGALILGALAAWACLHFNHEEGVEIRTYWSS